MITIDPDKVSKWEPVLKGVMPGDRIFVPSTSRDLLARVRSAFTYRGLNSSARLDGKGGAVFEILGRSPNRRLILREFSSLPDSKLQALHEAARKSGLFP